MLHGHVRSSDFERLRTTYSASPIEIASEIDRVLKADSRLAAKHELACEVAARARSHPQGESRSWLNDYRDRAIALGWKRADLAEIAAGEESSSRPSSRPAGNAPGESSPPASLEADAGRPSVKVNPEGGPRDAEAEAQVIPGDSRDLAGAGAAGGETEPPRKPVSVRVSAVATEAGTGTARNPPDRPSALEDDEFPVKRMIAGAVALLVVIVLVVALILGNDSPPINPAEQSAWQRAEASATTKLPDVYRAVAEQQPG